MRNDLMGLLIDYYNSDFVEQNLYGQCTLLRTYTDFELKKMFKEKNDIALFFEDLVFECVCSTLSSEYLNGDFNIKLEVLSNYYDKEKFKHIVCNYFDVLNRLGNYFINLKIDSAAVAYYNLMLDLKTVILNIRNIISDIELDDVYPELVRVFYQVKEYITNGYNLEKIDKENRCEIYMMECFKEDDYASMSRIIAEFSEIMFNIDVCCDDRGEAMMEFLSNNLFELNLDVETHNKLAKELSKYYKIKMTISSQYENISSNQR